MIDRDNVPPHENSPNRPCTKAQFLQSSRHTGSYTLSSLGYIAFFCSAPFHSFVFNVWFSVYINRNRAKHVPFTIYGSYNIDNGKWTTGERASMRMRCVLVNFTSRPRNENPLSLSASDVKFDVRCGFLI